MTDCFEWRTEQSVSYYLQLASFTSISGEMNVECSFFQWSKYQLRLGVIKRKN